MAYRLTPQECENIVRGKTDSVHKKELTRLRLLLEEETDSKKFILLQGRIKQLRLVMDLYQKAFDQLN